MFKKYSLKLDVNFDTIFYKFINSPTFRYIPDESRNDKPDKV